MNGVRRGFAGLMCLATLGGLGPREDPSSQEQPIDRWLVARAAAPDTMPRDSRLSADLLVAPGEPGVLPDRGTAAAGVPWRLVRRDGEASVFLDSVLSGVEPGTVAYAHAYIRLPRDRTLRLEWGGSDCTGATAWLNGREIAEKAVDARFGAGWNTLLLKLVAGDCPFGYHATLTAGGDGAEAVQARVQASRPYGDVRTGPDDWVVVGDTVRVAPERHWRGDRLHADLVVELTAWGRGAVSDVEVELRDGADGRAAAPWLVPGRPTEVVVPVRRDRLDRLLSSRQVGVRLRWGGEEVDRRAQIAGVAPGTSEHIALGGWTVRQTADGTAEGGLAGRLPNAEGWRLEGEWKVPEDLAGRTLLLDTERAPADYVVDGSPTGAPEQTITLCSPCRRGLELRLAATSTDSWRGLPLVRVGGDDE